MNSGSERELDPVEGARDGVLQRAQREGRQRQAHQHERHEVVVADAVAEHEHRAEHDRADRDAVADAQQAAADEKAAQAVEVAAGAVFRNEALRRRADAERAQHAEEADPRPGIDIDAELEAAHPARQHDLAHEQDAGADDTDQERAAGDALGGRMVAAVGEPRGEAVAEPRERVAR